MPRLPLLAALSCLPALGCAGGSGGPVPAASYDPDQSARRALDEWDRDKDGFVAGAELDACPGVKAAAARIDANHDKKLSRDELKARFEAYAAAPAATAVTCVVTLGGAPVSGAEVRFTPEPCHGDSLRPAAGTTDATGTATPVRDDGVPGLSPGLYRVTVTGPGVPPDYASRPLLGHEVAAGARGGGDTVELKLVPKPK